MRPSTLPLPPAIVIVRDRVADRGNGTGMDQNVTQNPGGLPPAPTPPDRVRFRAILDATPEPVLLIGAERRIELANAAAVELLGPGLEGAQVLAHIRQPDPVSALEAGFARLAAPEAAPGPFEARKILSRPNSETIYRMTVTPLSPDAGFSGLLVFFHDISHIEEAEQQRRDFVANVSHEMRSPLTALAGFIETLRGSARDDAAARETFLSIMEREAQRMARLVSDLLSLSKVESSERMRPRSQVSLSEVIHATLAALRPLIEDSRIDVAFVDLPDVGPIPGDRDQLVQVFHNLVENAVKYGRAGGRLEIEMARAPEVPGIVGPALRVSVRDFGDGIDAIHLPRLTERFYRVDGHRSRAMGGTGLGLAIVKHIIGRHRGKLSIHSTRGEGSTFTVYLPTGTGRHEFVTTRG
ncbi:MAG: two-component system, OmpR family, phosphate regulon sensor histidine kinase PhoR [Rhodobacteraceae bacterium HLUCCA12]|nr:MAG: two-component system, OmpR family, phosphate regulon sensor histidine kinase PhoR [Rhodobacteraceae bacterium HLUCCA12]